MSAACASVVAPPPPPPRVVLPLARPAARTLCTFDSAFSNSGRASIKTSITGAQRAHGSSWRDERSIELDWTTNTQECESDVRSSECVGCLGCPCRPVFDLYSPRSGTSAYVIHMCRKVKREFGCDFRNAIVVGLGIGSLSACLRQQCPCMQLTTVDVDPAALSIVERFFGWENRSAVSLVGAGQYFRTARRTNVQADLVVLDCFTKHQIPDACKTPELLADIRHVLPRNRSLFAANVLNPRSSRMPEIFSSRLSRPHTVERRDGQWIMLWNGHEGVAYK